MSTQFTNSQGQWRFTFWFSGTSTSNVGSAVDFGARPEAAFEVMEAMEAGETFFGEDGRQVSDWSFFENRAFTFGEFGGSFEVGRGDMMRFEGFE